ncbi:hypothetical protein M7I_7152 [Glarea lozoyensis 74030]|uniref:Uncharacterized protein n=1 Tax=Glarea lozoyensis (strain ATCC 74030 / MF5533) TaxID=1104152 RepID=H0EWI5_GLAL7|nr:hypothetical protein M7I_7152 [Glarea lozoyensis 74030]
MAHSTSEFNKSSTKIVETHSETGVQAVRAGDAGVSAFLRTVERIRDDLAELERLLKVDSVKTHLNGTPDKLPYIENVAKNTKAALKEVEVLIEREGANQTANTNSFDTIHPTNFPKNASATGNPSTPRTSRSWTVFITKHSATTNYQ